MRTPALESGPQHHGNNQYGGFAALTRRLRRRRNRTNTPDPLDNSKSFRNADLIRSRIRDPHITRAPNCGELNTCPNARRAFSAHRDQHTQRAI